MVLFQVKVLYDYQPARSDELQIEAGDVVDVFRNDDPDWWFGGLRNGSQGYFPANYVTEETGIGFDSFKKFLQKSNNLQLVGY